MGGEGLGVRGEGGGGGVRGEFYFATFCESLLHQANMAETEHSVVFSVLHKYYLGSH